MLVLSRQRDETIMIGDDIEITVVDIRGDKVRLGIAAPREIHVHRKEVYDAIRSENADASRMNPNDLTVADRQLRSRRPTKPNGKQTTYTRNSDSTPPPTQPAKTHEGRCQLG